MRILHTSDWHLGQHFIGKTRQAEHRALIAWLLEQVSALNIDAVLLAGGSAFGLDSAGGARFVALFTDLSEAEQIQYIEAKQTAKKE